MVYKALWMLIWVIGWIFVFAGLVISGWMLRILVPIDPNPGWVSGISVLLLGLGVLVFGIQVVRYFRPSYFRSKAADE